MLISILVLFQFPSDAAVLQESDLIAGSCPVKHDTVAADEMPHH